MVSAGSSAAEWEARANIPYHIYGHMAAALGDRVHLMGGCSNRPTAENVSGGVVNVPSVTPIRPCAVN